MDFSLILHDGILKVASDLLSAKSCCDTQLSGLGPPRTNSAKQRLHLIRIAISFQDLTAQALDTYYSRNECSSTNERLRLVTKIKTLQDSFSSILCTQGAIRGFRLRKRSRLIAQPVMLTQRSSPDQNRLQVFKF